MIKIFLSSTYKDLKKERQAIELQINKLKNTFIGMEYFLASDETPIDISLEALSRSDLVIFVIAHRYGSTDSKSGYSIVEMEYNKAFELSKPTLIYFKDKLMPVLPEYVEQDYSAKKKLSKFRDNIRARHTIGTFTNPDNLAAQVSVDLSNYLFEIKRWENSLPLDIGKYRRFWTALGGEQLIIIIETRVPHHNPRGLEYTKNINAVLGLSELISSLRKLGLNYTIKSTFDKFINKQTNLILDGSHLSNTITDEIIKQNKVIRKLTYINNNSEDKYTRWLENVKENNKRYSTVYEEGKELYPEAPKKRIIYDYGFLAKIRNPYDESKICLIASVNHGAGTYACMKVLATPQLLNRIIERVGQSDFQAVIGVHLLEFFEFDIPEIKEIVVLE